MHSFPRKICLRTCMFFRQLDVPLLSKMVRSVFWQLCTAVQHATSTHTLQDRHLATPRTPYAAFVKEIIKFIAPEDGHVSPKHELK